MNPFIKIEKSGMYHFFMGQFFNFCAIGLFFDLKLLYGYEPLCVLLAGVVFELMLIVFSVRHGWAFISGKH